MRYAVVIEKAGDNFSAYVPDLPGCIATGDTLEEVELEIRATPFASTLRDLKRTGFRFRLQLRSPNISRREVREAAADRPSGAFRHRPNAQIH
jgi:hypothetical protein